MEPGLEFKHSVTTTITAEKQTVVNETQLLDGDDVVLSTNQTVSIPVGKTYHIEAQGDINGNTIKRVLNVANNLLGTNAFSYEDTNEATDTDTVKFTAQYNAETFTFSGTAPVNSEVRIVFEDGTNAKVEPLSTGAWSHTITEDELEYGTNQIVLINGTKDTDLITIAIERERPPEPFNDEFTYVTAASGQSISGTVADSRATVNIDVDGKDYSTLPGEDLTWTVNLDPALAHNSAVSITVSYEGTTSAAKKFTHYKNSAQLDQTAGQTVTGTAEPFAPIKVTTTKYGEQNVSADAAGLWDVDFSAGLPANEAVKIEINGVALPDITYTGPADIEYTFTAIVMNATTVQGQGTPGETVTVTPSNGGDPSSVLVDQTAQWEVTLSIPLNNLDTVQVSTSEQQITASYVFFEADIVTKTQLEGIAIAGTTVSVGESNTLVGDNNRWTLILPAALTPNQVITLTNGQESAELTYVVPFTAYVDSEGLSVIGTSSEASVLITIDGVDQNIVVDAAGDWIYTPAQALTVGQVVTVQSGIESKVMTYTGVTAFTAELSPNKDQVTGNVDAAAKIRVIFEDNSMVEQQVEAGVYVLDLGRVVAQGSPIVVSCIVDNTLHKAITIYA